MSAAGTIRSFTLSSSFLSEFKDKQPAWGYNGLGYVVYKRTYARTKPDGSLEEFWETCQRVVEGTYDAQKRHCKQLRLPWDDRKAQRSAQEMYRRMWAFKWLPPGRGLWMMGSAAIDRLGGAALNNCGFVSTRGIAVDFADPFCWLMDMLMLGVGVGFDTKGAGLIKVSQPVTAEGVFEVEDSREGWVNLLRLVLNSYVGKTTVPATIDYSKVRPAGAPIAGFGGVASGPAPLQELVQSVRDVLDKLIDQPITTSAITDLCNLVGRCVVAGNVRRSAEIAFGDPNDDEFLNLKNPDINQEALYHHRWASNNSVFAEEGMDYSKVAALTAKNGEPGYQWLDNARKFSRMRGTPDYSDMRVAGANPCVEQSLEDRELCCLVETFPGRHETFEDYKKTLKYAYLYAKTVTLIPTHDARTNTVMMRNRRIGCSMSGITQAMQKFGRRKFLNQFCDEGYTYLRELDTIYSDWLCVRTSIKVTSVKPSGTVSLLPGVTPGIHFPHAEYYIRRVRLQEGSPLVGQLKAAGYPIEQDKYSPNTVVATFPVQESNFDRSKDAVTLWEQLELAAQMQQYWADNQVSVTVTFKSNEAQDIKHALELYETRLKGVSFLPLSDHGYEQAPYETITKEQYDSLASQITPINADALVHEETSRFCDGETCTI
jgi:ribonucleoside-triphosphate reductase